MQIRSYYIILRKRFGLEPRKWNKFLHNLKRDYLTFNKELMEHELANKDNITQQQLDDAGKEYYQLTDAEKGESKLRYQISNFIYNDNQREV